MGGFGLGSGPNAPPKFIPKFGSSSHVTTPSTPPPSPPPNTWVNQAVGAQTMEASTGLVSSSRLDSSPILSSNQKKLYESHANCVPPQTPVGFASVYSQDVMSTSTTKSPNFHTSKRSRSPSTGASSIASHLFEADSRRLDLSPTRSSNQKKFHGGQDIISTSTKSSDFHAPKRSRSPPVPSSGVSATASYPMNADSEREIRAKAKRLARFGSELSQPVQNVHDHNRNISCEATAVVSQDRDIVHDQEENEPSAPIIGLCKDMCPESEREERERKGDLDQYERLNGDRNQTHISIAVKKYNRTAERLALLIRPMPVLRKTMDYLLHLLDQPYDDKFLGMYNFLWDRMRAVRMDLRMQHIFNKDAIAMLEQMIRLHIVAMHELCEYAKGEGFSEGFDAHLNIEQMNKASAELFHMYDDHRKNGLHVTTENEFRGYYALLKLDRHPGYKVEPAELSLDLAKMTPSLRCSPEILFARAVARACRSGNFIMFFRLARRATYLQACLMHAHFSKLRRNALASLHSSLQSNQGIPIVQVIQWLGMEGEDIENLLEYHGFAIKTFEETYMVKDGPFLNGGVDYTMKCSELVHSKKSRNITNDVSANQLSSARNFTAMPEVSLHSFKRNKHLNDDVSADQISFSRSSVGMTSESSVCSFKRKKPSPKIIESPIVSNIRDTFGYSGKILESPGTTSAAREKIANEDIKIPSFKVQPAAPNVEMPDFADVSSPRDDCHLQPSLIEATISKLQGNSEHTFEDKNIVGGMPILRDESPFHHDPLTHGEVVELNTEHTSYDPPVSTADRLMQMQMSTSSMPDFTTGSPSYNKEMHDERPTKEASLQVVRENSEVAKQRHRMILRIWKRWASRKREIREQRRELANIALNSISLGPPIRQTEIQSCDVGEKFNLDDILKERSQRYGQSWSRLNISNLVGPPLSKRNPKAKCLCWKLAICINKSDVEDNSSKSLMPTWLLSKLMDRGGNDELVIDSPGLCIWKSLVDGCGGGSPSLCLSVVRKILLGEHIGGTLNDAMIGTNAIIYVISETVPWEIQRSYINMLLASVPSQSRVPLILCSSLYAEDAHLVVSRLGLQYSGETNISGISVISLGKAALETHVRGFFSDENLRKGLEWLAEQTLPQPNLHLVKTRELVSSYLSPLIETLYNLGPSEVDANHSISIFNKALDRSIKQIQSAADMNLNHWPCPEIDLLYGSNVAWQMKEVDLPVTGWSSDAKTMPVVDAIRCSKLPHFSCELSFLSQGSHMGKNLPLQKTRLEECLFGYLAQSAQIMSGDLARKEAHLLVQKNTGLELRDFDYRLIPRWVMIFQRIYNLRLMNLMERKFAWAYVSESVASTMYESLDGPCNSFQFGDSRWLNAPTLDEMMRTCCNLFSNWEAAPLETPESRSHTTTEPPGGVASDSRTSDDEDLRLGGPSEAGRSSEPEVAQPLQQNRVTTPTPIKAGFGCGKLEILLERCKVLQDRIGRTLSVYFPPN